MPARSKVRWSQLKVGIVGLAAFLILFVLVFLLTSSKGTVFRRDALLRSFMEDAGGMGDGTPVRLNGITIGYLDRTQLVSTTDPKRTVEFDMLVRREYLERIPVDSVVEIAAANLLGDKFLNITMGASQQHAQDGAELKSQTTSQDIPELLKQMATLISTFQTSVNRVDSLLAGVEAGKGNLGKLLKDEELYKTISELTAEGDKLLVDIRTSNGTLYKLVHDDALYEDLRAPLKRVDAILANIQAGQGSVGKALNDPALYNEARDTIAELHKLMAEVNAGKGSVGKAMKDEELYHQAVTLVSKLNATLEKITAGQGTIGQFVVNPELYNTLNSTTAEIQSLVKDLHANPKKLLTIQLKIF
ncbi:MAG TPA: MlaD family protein [Bryobacteraceae bacterium]|nr:MlaD family protein [Bryobacteraceae bacterium]